MQTMESVCGFDLTMYISTTNDTGNWFIPVLQFYMQVSLDTLKKSLEI